MRWSAPSPLVGEGGGEGKATSSKFPRSYTLATRSYRDRPFFRRIQASPVSDAPTIAHQLASWALAVTPAEIPARQRDLAALRVIDTIGLIFAGFQTPAAAAMYDVVATQSGRAESTLIGATDRVPAVSAALAHGTFAHCRDFDDTFPDSVVHPGSVVVPVALAVGEARDAPLDDVLAAIVVGYEISARLGAAAGRAFHAHGFHASSVIGPLAAAATAARFLGLDADRLASAFGLAASMSGGLLEFAAQGTWSKWLHTGWAAQGGITAANLAGRGFRGPGTVIEGKYGLYRSFLGDDAPALDGITADLGTAWRGEGAHFKYYPCAHVIQPYIDAALELRATHAIEAGAVTMVTCHIADWAVPIVCEPRAPKILPTNEMEAIASLPYQVAAALTDAAVGLHTISARALEREDVRALAARVEHHVDPALGHAFDGVIEIILADGTKHTAPATTAPAEPGKVLAKFRANAGAALPDENLVRIESIADRGNDLDLTGLLDAVR